MGRGDGWHHWTGIRSILAVIVALACLVGLDAPARSDAQGEGLPADQGNTGPGYATHPLVFKVFGHDSTGKPIFGRSAPGGYTPQQIAHYLGLAGDGQGQTIAISDAFHAPNIRSDVNHFSRRFGLPQTCSRPRTSDCFDFVQLTPPNAHRNFGWAGEATLDVEWAHAVAPKATVILTEALDNANRHLFAAIDRVAGRAGVVSNSWGEREHADEQQYDGRCALSNGVCLFATGDSGNPGGYPAYNPNAIAVGGTTLVLDAQGNVTSETAWSCSRCRGFSGTGGGVSRYEPRPSYQDAVSAQTGRGIPDVSFDADVKTGLPIFFTFESHGFWYVAGGTSVGTPVWAAIFAVADQLRAANQKGPLAAVGFGAQNALYGLGTGLYDVTTGSNGTCVVCRAGPGYDFVTGLGSPRAGIDAALAAAP